MLLITNGRVLCPDKIVDNGAICIDGNKIAEVGDTSALRKKYPNAEIIDAKGGLVMPGLTNAHMHLYSTFARGMSLPGEPSKNFVEILNNLWWRLDKALTKEDVYYSSLVPLIECVRCGTTSIIDHHASPNFVEGSLNTIECALAEVPVRASLCYEVSDRDGEKITEEGIKENTGFVRVHRGSEMLRGMFGLHASFTVSDKTLEKCVEAVRGLDCGFHVHTAEDKADLDDAMNKYGMGVVERWHKRKVLGPKTLLAHCIHISEQEMGLLAETRTCAAHNPESNMNNAVGSADVIKLLEKGVLLGLGTDGMTSDMFCEAKFAHLLRKQVTGDPRVGFVEAITLLFENNNKIFEQLFGWRLGRVEAGALADIIICDYDPPTPLTRANFAGHFLYGMGANIVRTTIINGRVVMKDRQIASVDEEEICAKARECAVRLWKRI